MQRTPTLICQLVKHAPKPHAPSIETTCQQCTNAIWVSHQAILEIYANSIKPPRGMYYVCTECAPPDIKKHIVPC